MEKIFEISKQSLVLVALSFIVNLRKKIVKPDIKGMSNTLLPVDPQILMTKTTFISAMGLLSQNYPEAALNILKKKLYRLNPSL